MIYNSLRHPEVAARLSHTFKKFLLPVYNSGAGSSRRTCMSYREFAPLLYALLGVRAIWTNRSLGFVILAFSSLLAPLTFGQDIFSINISGPGGTGTAPVPNGGYFLDSTLTYTSADYIDVNVGVSTPGIILVNAESYFVTNNTGQTWTGFTLELQPGFSGASFTAGTWMDNSGDFPTVVTGADSVSFSGGSRMTGAGERMTGE